MRFLVTISLVLASITIFAQDSLEIRHKPKHAIKWSPIHLLGFYPTLQLAYEASVGKKLSVQGDVGYVINYEGGTNTEYMNKRGVKLKAELRYYFESLPGSQDGFYASIEPYITSINFDRSTTTSECFDPNCQNMYLKYFTYKVEYRETGFSGKGGYVIYFDNDILLDISIGWSWRVVNYDHPDNVRPTTSGFNFFGPNEQDRIVFSPLVGVRVGYRLK
ncbi:MAG: DUF3575 domain-containing protein [Cytophagia bacterium]|nr:DUF3575 domain-containing protein [Cytophagia bacterium]